jgi:hypothetical protein
VREIGVEAGMNQLGHLRGNFILDDGDHAAAAERDDRQGNGVVTG